MPNRSSIMLKQMHFFSLKYWSVCVLV